MERTLSNECKNKVGKQVKLAGWLHIVRSLGKINFLILRDRGGLIQIVIFEKEELKKIEGLQEGTILEVTGLVQGSEQTEFGVEIVDPEITIKVPIKEVPPIEYNKKDLKLNIDTELDYRPLVLRNPRKQAIFKVQAGILEAFSKSMKEQGFIEFRTPVLMGAPSESGADVFKVNYYEGNAYLAQSPQIYKQIMVGAYERVFTIATVFRAEKHNTSRHIMEITHLDGEMGFIENYEDVLEVIEQTVRDILDHLIKNYKKELELGEVVLPKLPEGKFPRIKVKDAFEVIEKRIGKSSKREELDVDPEDERELGKWALEEHGTDFLFLTHFKKNKNFYTWNDFDNPEESISYDLVCRGIEWLSGTHRIHEYEELYKRFKEEGLDEKDYEHYFQAFKFGMPNEAGFSFGLERMTQQIFQLPNIRSATLFPSDLKRIAGAKRRMGKISSGDELVTKIKKFLESRAVEYDYLEHEPVITSEEASEVRNTSMEEGRKVIILRGKKSKDNFMVVFPSNLKLDMKKVKDVVDEAVEFEKPEVIKEKWGIEVGGVPPFGNLLGMKVLWDKRNDEEKRSAFNCGIKTASIIMKTEDLKEVLDGEVGDFVKE